MYVCVCVSVCTYPQRPEECTVSLRAQGSCEPLDMKDRN